ncbi:MAG: molybdopterin converting factor subunit 1 [gamma proteobacterium symbiont of Bathyaustriella thionipta]|nr:molybdopterin converting factor subunit 1 [gamma proteobacterium symbiont of Bathyaustriella thionipta]
MIRLRYFASLREALETDGEALEPPADIHSMQQLRQWLAARGGVWAEQFGAEKRLMMAINQTMVRSDDEFSDNDEVAFFPPVTGG